MKKIICFSISGFVLIIAYLNHVQLFHVFWGENSTCMTSGQSLYMFVSTLACTTVFPVILYQSYWLAFKNKVIAYLIAFFISLLSYALASDYFVMELGGDTDPFQFVHMADVLNFSISIVALVLYLSLFISTKIRKRKRLRVE